jgi:hypothetical protein
MTTGVTEAPGALLDEALVQAAREHGAADVPGIARLLSPLAGEALAAAWERLAHAVELADALDGGTLDWSAAYDLADLPPAGTHQEAAAELAWRDLEDARLALAGRQS